MKVDVSIVIITTSREKEFDKALNSILCQQSQGITSEIIVVCNGTRDYLKVVKQKVGHNQGNVKVTVLYEQSPYLHSARHRGLNSAKGEYIVFCDDDIEASNTWITEIYTTFKKNPSIDLVCSRVLPKFTQKPPVWLEERWSQLTKEGVKCVEHLSIVDCGKREKMIDPLLVFGCAFSIKKDILIKSKGFHPDSVPQDQIALRGDGESYVANFAKEHGHKALYNPRALVYHVIPPSRMNIHYFYRRSVNSGISESFSDIRNNRQRSFLLLNIIFRYFIINIKLITANLQRQAIDGKYLQKIIQKGYYAGYLFHQIQFIRNKKIQVWVMKDNYL